MAGHGRSFRPGNLSGERRTGSTTPLVCLYQCHDRGKRRKTIKNGMLLVRKGKIEAVGSKLNIPRGAVVRDLEGKFIYPSFIDLYSSYGLPDSPERNRRWDAPPQFLSGKQGAYAWNEAKIGRAHV